MKSLINKTNLQTNCANFFVSKNGSDKLAPQDRSLLNVVL